MASKCCAECDQFVTKKENDTYRKMLTLHRSLSATVFSKSTKILENFHVFIFMPDFFTGRLFLQTAVSTSILDTRWITWS